VFFTQKRAPCAVRSVRSTMGRTPVRCVLRVRGVACGSAQAPGLFALACIQFRPAALSRASVWRRLKEVVYTLSNHNQNVMSGLWKDLPYKITKKVKENWLDNLFFLVPLVGTYQCVPASVAAVRRARAGRGGGTVSQENRRPGL